MSALIEALEIIKQYHIEHPPKYYSEIVSRLKPGLSRQQIREISKDFSYTLPEEIYELYQWHNGIDDSGDKGGWNYFISTVGGVFGYLPLEEALKKSQNLLNLKLSSKEDIRRQYEPNWLLIFDQASDVNAAGVVVVIENQKTYVRSYDPEDWFYGIIHSSLTNMMLSNAIRKGNLSGKDFSGGDFKNLHLDQVNLTNANLESTDFRGANLTNTNLEGANIKNMKTEGAFYSDITIFPQDIDKSKLIYVGANADLSNLDLRGIYFNNMNLENTNFSNADLAKNYLNNANLKNANFSGANLERANLEGANLSGANLEGANLHGAYLSGAILTNANLLNAQWVDHWVVKDSGKNPIFYNTVMPDGSIKN